MACAHRDEEKGNGDRHIFVSLQSQTQQHAAQEVDDDEDDLAIVGQDTCPVLHIRRTVAILQHHRFVCQHEVVVEEGAERVGHDEVDNERCRDQHEDENHPSEG